MSNLKVSIGIPGATAAQLAEIAPIADHWNVNALWIGDPQGAAANRADSYVTATAGAITALTQDLRLGLFLGLGREKQLVRIAEDVGVLDQASGGRVELGLVAPGDATAWTRDVARFLRAWHAWEVPSTGEHVAVIPRPAQPVVPYYVVEDAYAAQALGAGRIVAGDAPASDALVPPRTILLIDDLDLGDGIAGWLSAGAADRVMELRQRGEAAAAHEIVLLAEGFSHEDLKAIGTVLVPSLRASTRDARFIATDSWTWLTKKAALHEPPR